MKKSSFGKKFALVLLIIVVICYTSAFIIIGNSKFSLGNLINECINNPNFHFGFMSSNYKNSYNLNLDESYNLTGIDKISTNFPIGNISVNKFDGDNIKVVFNGTIYSNEDLGDININFSKENSTLNVYLLKRSNNIRTSDCLEIYIPAKYSSSLSLSSIGGRIDIVDLNPSNISVSTTSGNVNMSNLKCDSININTTSGNIEGNNVTCKTSELNSTSGDIHFTKFIGGLNASTLSGNINSEFSSITNTIKLNTTSGDISMYFPEISSLNISSSSVSGTIDYYSKTENQNINTEKQFIYTLNNGDYLFSVSSISGNITLNTF